MLSERHVFYQQIHAFLSVALGVISQGQAAQRYPALHSWIESMGFNFGESCIHMLSGVGKHGKGLDYVEAPQEFIENRNFLPSASAHTGAGKLTLRSLVVSTSLISSFS